MRGDDERPDAMFSYVSPEARIPATHPLRPMPPPEHGLSSRSEVFRIA